MTLVFAAMAYYEQVYPEVIDCLIASKTQILYSSGTRLCSTNIDLARSELAGRFLESQATHMLCIDSDTWWQGDLVTQLVEEDCNIILAAYADRKPPFQYHIRPNIDDVPSRWGKHGRILEIANAGIGCCLIKRSVVEKMWIDYSDPELTFYSRIAGKEHRRIHIFQKLILSDFGTPRAFGEDYGFEARARETGFKIECLASAEMFHAGVACCLERDVYGQP
jgi:hypothetical protein